MTRNEWRIINWVWAVDMTLIGAGLLLYPVFFMEQNTVTGQGTALLLVAASLLFTAVFATWDWRKNRLAAFASFGTAVFGFLGTSYILAAENSTLLAILIIASLYSLLMGLPIVFSLAYVIRRIRGETSRRNGD